MVSSSVCFGPDDPCQGLAWICVFTVNISQTFMITGFPFDDFSDVKVKDLVQNISKLTHELQSSIHISNETIHSLLEASISRSQVRS